MASNVISNFSIAQTLPKRAGDVVVVVVAITSAAQSTLSNQSQLGTPPPQRGNVHLSIAR